MKIVREKWNIMVSRSIFPRMELERNIFDVDTAMPSLTLYPNGQITWNLGGSPYPIKMASNDVGCCNGKRNAPTFKRITT